MSDKTAIVVGAGILGMATARALALKGYKVTILEKSQQSLGASIRNFGMLWPIGQPDGHLYERAIRSREIWKAYLKNANIPFDPCGSIHLAYDKEEQDVIEELYNHFLQSQRPVALLSPSSIQSKFKGINATHLKSGLFSSDETIIDPREGIKNLPIYLKSYYNIDILWGTAVTNVTTNTVWSFKTKYNADIICICSGADFETLYPAVFKELPIIKTKLQMMRYVPNDPSFRIGTSVCGGLSLLHYKSFAASASLDILKEKIQAELPEYIKWGIHVMVAQNDKGELTIGDTHEYALDFEPFDKQYLNDLVLQYLKKLMHIDNWTLQQSWNGVYPKMTNGETDLFLKVEPGVFIINGIGGNGMTLSFGFAEEAVEKI
jgi:FAD dependent oxidoreductase TIGR03364